MAVLLGYKDVRAQSLAVFGQFGESKWIPYAKINRQLPSKPADSLRNSGVGQFMVMAAMGESLEEKAEIIKKHRSKFKLVTCDKGFGALLKVGIKADFVQVADCNIPFDKWLKPYVEETAGVSLLATVYANPEWTTAWRGDRYFYVNRDCLGTEKRFQEIWGPGIRTVVAGSNVSNAMVIFFAGTDESNLFNWGAYERYILVGYDYSWRPRGESVHSGVKQGNYYAWNDPAPKRNYMNHRTLLDISGDWVHTSENLMFSARWLYSYITSYGIPAVNCSGRGILDIPAKADLEQMLSGIDGSPERLARARRAFELMQSSYDTVRLAKDEFEDARRGLTTWR